MATILDKYGIKEVCDVTFYKLNSDGTRGVPVLYLDTLKVTTTEQSADAVDAQGGKGNPVLITWDTSRDITVSIEDALFSAKSLAMTYGANLTNFTGDKTKIVKTIMYTPATDATGLTSWTDVTETVHTIDSADITYTDVDGNTVEASALVANTTYYATFAIKVSGAEFSVTSTKFPGTYYVTGDTYSRSQASGEDSYFQLIFPKAKITSDDVNITLEADGDPATFNMNLRLMRADGNTVMKLVKYDVDADSPAPGPEPTPTQETVTVTLTPASVAVEGTSTISAESSLGEATFSYAISEGGGTIEGTTITAGTTAGTYTVTATNTETNVSGTATLTVTTE